MDPAMPTPSASVPGRRRVLRRDRGRGLLGGVCAGLAAEMGIDPLIVRVAFVAGALAGGVGLAAYVLAWALLPAADPSVAGRQWAGRLRTGRAEVQVALGAGLLLLSVLLTFRSLGVWLSDAVVWPVVLVTSGGALIWRQSLGGHGDRGAGATAPSRDRPFAATLPRASDVSRTGLGIGLVIAAGFAFLQATGTLGAA
ncbi:MAG: hypothetical protein QOJ07_3133, partial [Thermoleophilaceae bacterium]|nr:hypothetical protein [Thermoleophilaceae bacterium]